MKTVLFVDDDEISREYFERSLAPYRSEFRVVTAGDGMHALDLWHYREIDLVVTDLQMPVMGGFQLMVSLLQEAPSLPIIVMTAFGSADVQRMAREFSPFEYLEKPVQIERLLRAIRIGLNAPTRGYIKGVTLIGFLQLLHIERKTCTLRIHSLGRSGLLHFEEGELINAEVDGSESVENAYDIAMWADPEIQVEYLSSKKRRVIDLPLDQVLMEAVKRSDENNHLVMELEAAYERDSPPVSIASDALVASSDATDRITLTPELLADLQSDDDLDAPSHPLLDAALRVEGVLAAALIEGPGGVCVAMATGLSESELWASRGGRLMRSRLEALTRLLLDDELEEIVITLGRQYHVVRPHPMHESLFVYLVLDRNRTDPAQAWAALLDEVDVATPRSVTG